jgi:AcrR family transcriptional regulator
MENSRQTDLTRDKLLTSAFGEIHRQGFQAASIANILQDTGLTKGALYHHFPTKQALGLAVIDEVIQDRLEHLIFKPLRESPRPVQTLLDIVSHINGKRSVELVKLGCPLNNLMQEMSPLDTTFKSHLNVILNTWKDTVEEALRCGQMQNVIRPEVDCHAVALFIVSAWEGCIGIAKNLQSDEAFGLCMKQLHGYITSLATESPA